MNAIEDDECTALVKRPVYSTGCGKIFYISGHQDRCHWVTVRDPPWLLYQAWSSGSTATGDGMFSKEQTMNR
jgi:hypothetical protein